MSPAQDSPRFGRVITAMVTPFDDAGELDLPAAVALAAGSLRTAATGWCSRAPRARARCSATTRRSRCGVPWRKPSRFRSSPARAPTTRHTPSPDAAGRPSGVDGVLVVTPSYSRPSNTGIYEHFRAVAEAAGGLPVVLYDIPVRSGRRIDTPTMLRLDAGTCRRGTEGRGGRPTDGGTSGGASAGGLRDLQR